MFFEVIVFHEHLLFNIKYTKLGKKQNISSRLLDRTLQQRELGDPGFISSLIWDFGGYRSRVTEKIYRHHFLVAVNGAARRGPMEDIVLYSVQWESPI